MFQNNNKTIIKLLAKNSMKADKKRNFFIVLTITLAVSLMMILALYNLGNSRKTLLFLKGRYQAVFINMDMTTIHTMEKHEAIEKLGMKYELSTKRIDDYTLNILYKDKTALELLSAPKLTGYFPEQNDEILVEEAYLNHLGLKNIPGQKIKLNLGDGNEKDYTVSGILMGENDSRVYQIIPSLRYVESVANGTPLFEVIFRYRNSEKIPSELLKEYIKSLAEELKIPQGNIFFSSTYFNLAKKDSATEILAIVSISFLVIIACSLVIYSLFYISVIGKTREYGRLRVIGTTQKQVKKLVRKEGAFLSAVSIPLGILFGGVASYLLVPGGWYWPTAIKSAVIIALVTELTISIAIHTPVKIASSISPVEAVRITPCREAIVSVSNHFGRRITPFRLAWMNFKRNKKKTVLTLLSLGFTGILLMCSSSYLNSIDVEKMAEQSFPNGEFSITLNPADTEAGMVDSYTKVQQTNPLSPELEASLLSIEGVTGIEKFIGCKSDFIYPNDSEGGFRIIGLTRDQLNKYKPCLLEGTMDYDELVKNQGILVSDSEGLIHTYYKYKAQLGDTIQIKTDDGGKREFKVMGILDDLKTGIDIAFYYVPDSLLPFLKSNVSNFNTHFFVRAEKNKLNNIDEEIFKLTEKTSDLEVTTIKDVANFLQQSLDKYKTPLYVLITFIGLFGIINLINTLMTNLISRKQELGMLQSIGLTNRQLNNMLQTECLFFILGTMFLTLTVGTVFGILLCTVFKQFNVFGDLTYHFPILPLIIYFLSLLLVQGLYSVIAVSYNKKQPLIERIKTTE